MPHQPWSTVRRSVGPAEPPVSPESWYELLVDRTNQHSDLWYPTIEEALAGIREQLAAGADPGRLLLSWETKDGTVGLVAEGRALAAWALVVASTAEAVGPSRVETGE